MKKLGLLLTVLAMFSLSACQGQGGYGNGGGIGGSGINKQQVGGVGGALLGGLAGSQVGSGSGQLWATGAGVLLGALVGSSIGSSLDKADLAYAQQANQRAYDAPIGQTISWNNPESGNRGTVTPRRDGYSSSGRYCRQYEQTIYVGGRQETAVGTACQNSDGTWNIVE